MGGGKYGGKDGGKGGYGGGYGGYGGYGAANRICGGGIFEILREWRATWGHFKGLTRPFPSDGAVWVASLEAIASVRASAWAKLLKLVSPRVPFLWAFCKAAHRLLSA